MIFWIWILYIAPLFAEEETRPDLAEPVRATRNETYVVASLLYRNAEDIRPRDHALYSSFFALPDGPPPGASRASTITDLEMLEKRGRGTVIFSDMNFTYYWSAPQAQNREPSLQFGVNLIVCAMARQQAGPTLL